ncbi:MAG: hypothetical protein JNK64_30315 [Myxococcales bacterium]|nr:hypothetical protein [Myxococcales bacterium]
MHASERHAERWAPEGEGARKASGMRSLAFADRVATPWMSTANYSRMTQMFAMSSTGHSDRVVPQVSWLFPRPWFQDELDWMAAARMGLESTQRRGAMTTRGTFVTPTGESSWAGVAMPVLSPDVMAAVAPSMSGGEGAGLRAWSPGVDFAAAAAAEVVAGAVSSVAGSGLSAVAERSPIWSGLSMVTPRGLAPTSTSSSTSSFGSPMSAMATPSAMSLAAPRPTYTAPVSPSVVEAAQQSIARIESRVEELRQPATSFSSIDAGVVPQAAGAADASAPVEGGAPEASVSPLSSAEQRLADVAHGSTAASGALRTVELLLGALSGRRETAATSAAAAATSAAAAATASPDATSTPAGAASASSVAAVAPTAASMASANFAPAAGPRVAMPAGLGGLVQALSAADAVGRPMVQSRDSGAFAPAASMAMTSTMLPAAPSMPTVAGAVSPSARAATAATPAFSPVWAAPTSALAAVSASHARAVDHLTWSDRWLARFSGASPLAMSAFDSASDVAGPALRPLQVGSPEVVYVHPRLAPANIAQLARSSTFAAAAPERGAPAMPVIAPPTATRADGRPAPLRIDDSEAVPDSVFAAIAAASVAPVRPATTAATPSSARASDAAAARADVAASAVGAPALAAAPTTVSAPVDLLATAGRRLSMADLVAVAAPAAPDAGLAPGLASSPMAPALASMMPLPAAPVFDPRALHGDALATAYLGGLVARSAAPIGVLTGAPSLAALARAGVDAPSGTGVNAWMARDMALAPAALRLAEAAPQQTFIARGPDGQPRGRGFEPAASTVAASRERVGAAIEQTLVTPAAIAPSDAQVSQAAAAATTAASNIEAPAFAANETRALEQELVTLRAAMLAVPDVTSVPLAHAEHAPLVSGRVAVPSTTSTSLPSLGGLAASSAAPLATAQARSAAASLGDSIAMTYAAPTGAQPTLPGGEPTLAGAPAGHAMPRLTAASGRPGGLAEAALAWSIAEERSAANLAFDFVTPELILAAKVYGLSPGAAAEAVRLASAGPASMASMATQLDLTLLRAFQAGPAGAARPGAGASPYAMTQAPVGAAPGMPTVAAGPVPGVDVAAGSAPSFGAPSSFGAASPPAADAITASPVAGGPASSYAGAPSYAAPAFDPVYASAAWPSAAMASSAKLPRGAFLWPPGAVAALGLRALSPDGAAGLPVVALELLAAQAVAELGTLVTAYPGMARASDNAAAAAYGAPGSPAAARFADASMPLTSVVQGPQGPTSVVSPMSSAASPIELARAAELAHAEESAAQASAAMAVPSLARQRFESVYIALTRSAEGQSLSPAARAARAMSLVASSTPGLSPREAAAATWSMLPDVYRGGLDMVAPYDARAERGGAADMIDARPGLGGLAARAGESLGSFVSPSMAEVRDVAAPSETASGASSSAASRAAAPVYVENAPAPSRPTPSPFSAPRPGRAFGQFGGGEPEVPAWFESAAQRMFSSGDDRGGGMNLAQMVLVTAMPQQQVAAATRGTSAGGGGGSPAAGGSKHAPAEKPDVEQLAFEVYHEVMHLLDIARKRSGDPFQ